MFGSLNIYHHQFMNIPLLTCKQGILYAMVYVTVFYPSRNLYSYRKSLIWMKKLRDWCTNMEIDNIDQFSNKTYINNEFEYSFT